MWVGIKEVSGLLDFRVKMRVGSDSDSVCGCVIKRKIINSAGYILFHQLHSIVSSFLVGGLVLESKEAYSYHLFGGEGYRSFVSQGLLDDDDVAYQSVVQGDLVILNNFDWTGLIRASPKFF